MTRPKKILIVDDEAQVLYILSAALRTMSDDVEVETARNGREALERLQQEPAEAIDLLITDIQMPEVNGIELTQQVREVRPDLPVVWITAYGSERVREACQQLNVNACVDKPLTIAQIRQLARQALAREGSA